MKKILKGLSIICLALVMICPLALVGCDKHYTIDIKIVAGKGQVLKKDVEAINLVDKNTVDAGEKFEYYVVPRAGYRISKVVVDGAEQTNYSDTGAYFHFDDVQEDHKVEVSFIKTKLVVTLYCKSATNDIEIFREIEVNDNSSLNLNEAQFGGEIALWYRRIGTEKRYLYNNSSNVNDPKENIEPNNPEGIESNMLFVRTSDASIYCDKTADELLAMGLTK